MHKVGVRTIWRFGRPCFNARHFSTICRRGYQVDTAHVQVGSSGSIELQIYQPPHPQSTPANRLLIYFPPGPIPSRNQAPSPRSLSIGSNIPVISLNYRLSPDYRFPKAVFDVSTAFEWIKTHFLHYATASPSPGTRIPVTRAYEQIPRVGVAGEFCGGSLAAMLALTECHLYSTHVGAMVLGNPITDWTAMYRVAKDNRLPTDDAKAKKGDILSWNEYGFSDELSATDLLKWRRELFASPEAYFDPFVSPLLFFKTPASEVQSYDILAPKIPSSSSKDSDEFESFEKFNSDPETMEFLVKRRAHRRYPPLESEMRLPRTRIELGKESLIADQGRDLGEVIARSVEKHEVGGEGRGARRVEIVQEKDGIGAWDDADLERVGHWFARNLG